ncbi:MAG: non-homologous end joining protein Ku [Candidatus Xenobia bacterium]
MATTVWKGHLTFGLISVPIKLFAAARSEAVSFNQLHAPCKSRIKQQVWCPTCERVVERKELVKGYEIEPDRYVIIEEGDLEKITPPSGRTLEVMEFVRLSEVDPVYFNTSFYVVPETAGEKAYYLLCKALEHSGYVAIARIAMHQREHVVIVRPALEGMMLHTIYYPDEVRQVEEFGKPEKVAMVDKEMELAELFIKTLAAPFDIEKYKDTYRENALEMIRAKAAGEPVAAAPVASPPPVLDLMAALKASIEQQQVPKKPPASVEAEAAEKPRRQAAAG